MGWRVFVIGSCILLGAGVLASFIGHKSDFLIWFTGERSYFLDYFFYYITKLGEPPGYILAGILLLFSSWKKTALIPFIGGVVTLITYILKSLFQHERPADFLKTINWDGPTHVLDYGMLIGHTSFPSGHSMAAWALFTFTAAVVRNTWVSVVCLLCSVGVCLSRVYLMAHFLRDVVAGGIVGFGIGYGFYQLLLWWELREKRIAIAKASAIEEREENT